MEFPANSASSRESEEPPATARADEKRVQRVTTGEVIRRKPSLGKRIAQTFVAGDDAHSVISYVILEVIVPATKDAIADAVTQGVERMIFGETRSTSRRPGGRSGASSAYVNYSRFSPTPREGHRLDPRETSRRARAPHNFDNIILAARVEAEEVLDSMFELLSKYEQVTVADLYDLVGQSGDYTDQKWGWTDLRGAGAARVRDGYLLDLPRPEPLK